MKQTSFLRKELSAYGGELMKTRKGRSRPRPLATRDTMHLVLRSSVAKGEWSFRRHDQAIREIIQRFSRKYCVRVLRVANVGNHLHFQIKLSNRFLYPPFIRALTSAIMMAVTGTSRWNKTKCRTRFWDYRPFTRIVQSYRAFINLRDYIWVNQLEGRGHSRIEARIILDDREKFEYG